MNHVHVIEGNKIISKALELDCCDSNSAFSVHEHIRNCGYLVFTKNNITFGKTFEVVYSFWDVFKGSYGIR